MSEAGRIFLTKKASARQRNGIKVGFWGCYDDATTGKTREGRSNRSNYHINKETSRTHTGRRKGSEKIGNGALGVCVYVVGSVAEWVLWRFTMIFGSRLSRKMCALKCVCVVVLCYLTDKVPFWGHFRRESNSLEEHLSLGVPVRYIFLVRRWERICTEMRSYFHARNVKNCAGMKYWITW